MRISVLHGPNLNLLGSRQPEIYGTTTLAEIDQELRALAQELGCELTCRQTNSEGQLIDWIQGSAGSADGILINPGGYSHTSVAIRDALSSVPAPAIEVHLSNPLAREQFRHTDLVGGACLGVVAGFGAEGYRMALKELVRTLRHP